MMRMRGQPREPDPFDLRLLLQPLARSDGDALGLRVPARSKAVPSVPPTPGTGPGSSACVLTPAGEDRRQTPQRVAAAGRGAPCTCKLWDTGRPPSGGARSSDGLTAKPDLSPRVAAVPGRRAPSCNSAIDQHTPWPGPGRERTYRPVTATVVSLGRAPARPSDARRRRWRRDTTFTVGPYPGGDAPRPCRAHQGIAARPLRAAANARADVGWPAQRRCAARALMVHGSRFPRRGETGRGDPPPRCTSSGWPAATTAGRPYSAHRETPQAGPPRGSGLRRGNDGRVSGRTCPERTRRPTRR